jgi:hypothetical protein
VIAQLSEKQELAEAFKVLPLIDGTPNLSAKLTGLNFIATTHHQLSSTTTLFPIHHGTSKRLYNSKKLRTAVPEHQSDPGVAFFLDSATNEHPSPQPRLQNHFKMIRLSYFQAIGLFSPLGSAEKTIICHSPHVLLPAPTETMPPRSLPPFQAMQRIETSCRRHKAFGQHCPVGS